MSLYDYEMSREISATDPPFAALIMAAMRKADTQNTYWLRRGFPEIHKELAQRYISAGGLLDGEQSDRARGGLIEPSQRVWLESEQSCDFVLRDDCIRIINNLWVDQCGGCKNLDTCETCRSYSQAINAIRGE